MGQEQGVELSDVERIKIDRTYDRYQRLNFYEILNIPMDADRAQIKKAYYTVSKEFHPDRYFRRNLGSYKDRLEYIFDLITKAYNTLNDDTLRVEYDRSVLEARAADEFPLHEVQMEVTKVKPVPTASPTPTPTPEAKVVQEEKKPRGPRVNPLFMERLKKQILGRMLKARQYHKAGKEAFEKEQFAIAVGHLQMAVTYEPKLKEAKDLLEEALAQVADTRAETHYQRAIQEMNFGNMENALQSLRAAVDCKPTKGHYYYKLGTFLLETSKDRREAIEHLKKGASCSTRNIEYKLTLGEAYEDVDMPLNAKREYEKVLKIDRSNQQAQKSVKRLKSVV